MDTLTSWVKASLPFAGKTSNAKRRCTPSPLLSVASETLQIPALPNEIWDRIFALLTSRKDVGACRLACRSFKELSSPYFLTRVCFALRMDTLNKLYDVMEHPYFRHYVTELVYDSSRYDPRFEDPGEYEAARRESELTFESMTMVHQERLKLFQRTLRHPIPDEQMKAYMRKTIETDRSPIVYTRGEDGELSPVDRDVPWQR